MYRDISSYISEIISLPEWMEFGRLVESAFHYMLLACSGIIDPNLNSYKYFFGLSLQAYSAKAAREKPKGPLYILTYILVERSMQNVCLFKEFRKQLTEKSHSKRKPKKQKARGDGFSLQNKSKLEDRSRIYIRVHNYHRQIFPTVQLVPNAMSAHIIR